MTSRTRSTMSNDLCFHLTPYVFCFILATVNSYLSSVALVLVFEFKFAANEKYVTI